MSTMTKLGKLFAPSSALFVCDIQDRFVPLISNMPAVIDTAKRMIRAAALLEVPILVTEQYPRALGRTVEDLKAVFPTSPPPYVLEKTNFSMCTQQAMDMLSKEPGVRQVILLGIEAHVCVLQTALDLLENDFEVHVVVDGVSSQRLGDRATALKRMEQSGAFMVTHEMAMFQMMLHAKHAHFKAISALAKEERPDQLPGIGM